MVIPDYWKIAKEFRETIVEDKVIEQIHKNLQDEDSFDSMILKEFRIFSRLVFKNPKDFQNDYELTSF